MTTTTLKVRGMHCASCVSHVERSLRRVPGVTQAAVNLATEQATVEHDPAQAGVGRLIEAVKDAGYEAEAGAEEAEDDLSGGAEEPRAGPGDGQGSHGDPAMTGHATHDAPQATTHPWRNWMLLAALASPVVVLGMFFHHWLAGLWVQWVLATVIQIVLGRPFYRGALNALRHGRADMDTLVALGTSVAYVYSAVVVIRGGMDVYFDTSAVILVLISLGKLLEARARASAASAIRSLMELQPPTATVMRHGQEQTIPVSEVRPNDTVLVRPGERVPVDGVVLDGASSVDQSLVTGESMPVEVGPGGSVIGGTLNQTGSFHFTATRTGKATLLAQIVDMVGKAQASKAKVQRIADAVAGVFVPVVLAIALLTLLGWGWLSHAPDHWSIALSAMIAVLIVACPCALGLATPAAIMVGTGLGARHGILIKDAAALERAGKLTHVVLDKTGTLTVGRPEVTQVLVFHPRSSGPGKVHVEGDEETTLLRMAAAAEVPSEHPLGQAIVRYGRERLSSLPPAGEFKSITGGGVTAIVDGCQVIVGKPELLTERGISGLDEVEAHVATSRRAGQTVVVVGLDGRLAGIIALADPVKPGAVDAIKELRSMGLRVLLLTGDHATVAHAVADHLGIDEIMAGVLPQDKADKIIDLQRQGAVVAMVGDGINDAPALAAADIGIAMGGAEFQVSSSKFQGQRAGHVTDSSHLKPGTWNLKLPPSAAAGTDIAREAGHVVLVGGDLAGLSRAIWLSRTTMRRIYLGLFWAFIYNLVLIPVAAAGWMHPMFAAAAMAFSSVSVVLNALWLKVAWKTALADQAALAHPDAQSANT